MATDYKTQIADSLLGKTGEFDAFFRLYDELLNIGSRSFVVQIDNPSQQNSRPVSHDSIIIAAKVLKAQSSLSLKDTKEAIQKRLTAQKLSSLEVDIVLKVAVQLAFMVHPNVYDSHGPAFRIGSYRPASWLSEESFTDFVSKSFPHVSSTRISRVQDALAEEKSLKAWKLKERLGIKFRPTNNLAEHLVFDPDSQSLYLFHHAGYLKAHLDLWEPKKNSRDIGIGGAIADGTLSPRLLAETLHSLQSILFRWGDEKSKVILNELIKKQGFDSSCAIHEGYKMFKDGTGDFVYTFWGERLASIHDLMRERPPRTKFQKWIKWQTTERNFFLVGGLALIISAVVGILSLGLSGFQAYIAWQAWKVGNQPPT
ncbi:hypothetical protein QC762_405890 [Podospora pseudocomata]|uniref:Uncharacterized protein n=1 Tax=Podospora pseudocomata TaxID=2093779 RepID=A0ABR0GH02_9PEZI|nr:hypothetical protein QC762_405890 [Podospora pseudocomata]